MKRPKADAFVYKKLSKLAYNKHAGEIKQGLVGTGFLLDKQLSDRQHKVFYNRPKKPWCLTEERIRKIGWEFYVMYEAITIS